MPIDHKKLSPAIQNDLVMVIARRLQAEGWHAVPLQRENAAKAILEKILVIVSPDMITVPRTLARLRAQLIELCVGYFSAAKLEENERGVFEELVTRIIALVIPEDLADADVHQPGPIYRVSGVGRTPMEALFNVRLSS
jgi:hypothetical protein